MERPSLTHFELTRQLAQILCIKIGNILKQVLEKSRLFSVPIRGTFRIAKEAWERKGFYMGIIGRAPVSSLESAFNGLFTTYPPTGL